MIQSIGITNLGSLDFFDETNVKFHIQNLLKKEDAEGFVNFVKKFLLEGGNPNLTFVSITIEGDILYNPTLFHLVCFTRELARFFRECGIKYWCYTVDEDFAEIIDTMLKDRRLDVRSKFSEIAIHCSHFSVTCYPDGFTLKDMSIAHYVTAIGDVPTLDKILKIAPDLIQATCDIDKNEEYKNQQDLPPISRVTLLHLAARSGSKMMCGFLFNQEVNPTALDSTSLRPIDYLEQSYKEGLIKKIKAVDNLRKLLQPRPRHDAPFLPKAQMMLHKQGYDVCYDTRTKNPVYTYKRLTRNSLQTNTTREGLNFKADAAVPALNRAMLSDYKGSGYHRGHSAAAADANVSIEAMQDTFLLTNVSPQQPGFNQGYWKKLEMRIRECRFGYDLIEVFTGCIFFSQTYTDGKKRVSYETLGDGSIAVPTHFFKVIYLYKGQTISSVAYMLPNSSIDPNTPLEQFITTVSEVQKLSGILFDQMKFR